MRLKLAEAQSEQESSEKRWRCRAEEEAERIHSKYENAKNIAIPLEFT